MVSRGFFQDFRWPVFFWRYNEASSISFTTNSALSQLVKRGSEFVEKRGAMQKASLTLSLFFVCILPIAAGKEKIVPPPPEKLAEAHEISKRADSLLARKFFEDAVLQYQKVLAITPQDHVIHNKLGIAYHQIQILNLAKKQYDRAKKLNPKYHEAWNNLGTVNYCLKNYKRAVKDYKKALQIQPESATTHHNLGAAYFALKKYEEGFQAYQEAYRLDPNILERISTRGTIIRTAEVNQGIQNFYLAKLYITNGQPEKALAYLLKALETGFSDYERITKDPDFEVLAQDERLSRLISQKTEPFQP
jgi:tetratricopeptide (TPR) repeat protein